MMKKVIILLHLPRHAGRHGGAVTVLEGPHAVQVEEGHSVAILEEMIQVGLTVGHGAQVSINKGDAALLGRHGQLFQEIFDPAPRP